MRQAGRDVGGDTCTDRKSDAPTPSTCRAPDVVPHVLTAARILDASELRVVDAAEVPNPHWSRPGAPSAGQQAFGDALIEAHPTVLIPSVASAHSRNAIVDPAMAETRYGAATQERFALDPRLHAPAGA